MSTRTRRIEQAVGQRASTITINDCALRVEEVAAQTGWREATVRAKILRRELPYVKLGRSVRIMQSTVDELIAQNTIPALEGR